MFLVISRSCRVGLCGELLQSYSRHTWCRPFSSVASDTCSCSDRTGSQWHPLVLQPIHSMPCVLTCSPPPLPMVVGVVISVVVASYRPAQASLAIGTFLINILLSPTDLNTLMCLFFAALCVNSRDWRAFKIPEAQQFLKPSNQLSLTTATGITYLLMLLSDV